MPQEGPVLVPYPKLETYRIFTVEKVFLKSIRFRGISSGEIKAITDFPLISK